MIARLGFFVIALGVAWLLGAANREDTKPGFFGLAQALVLAALAFAGASLLSRGDPVGAVLLVCVVVLAFPWWVARRFLIPYGHWRSAWVVVRSSAWTWHDDNAGGALVAVAWAALRGGGSPRALAFVERRCEGSDCGAAHLLATGLVAQARGDIDAARRWIASLCEFEGAAAPRMARRLAVQWCAAEAASRGAWARIAELAGDRDADAVTRMLTTVARRLTSRAPIPEDAEIEQAWSKVAQKDRWRALVDRACAHEPREGVPEVPVREAPATEPDPHRAALLAHARLLGCERPARADIVATAKAWDRVLDDPAFVATARRRATEIGSRADPIEALRDGVDNDLVEITRTHAIALGEDPAIARDTIGRVRRALQQRLLDELEIMADALQTRVVARRPFAIHEEWREYLALRGAYQRAVAMTGPALLRLGFAIVNPAVCALAVWLWNDRKNRVHAHQMFLWLLGEAEVAGDAEAVALHKRNVDCGR